MTQIHMGNSERQLHTDGVLKNIFGAATSAANKVKVAVKSLNVPTQTPLWRSIDGAIDQEDAIIKTAFDNQRPISPDELKQIMHIREQRNGFVKVAFLRGQDPRIEYGNRLPIEGGTWDLQDVEREIAIRAKYRAEHPVQPGSQCARQRDSAIMSEQESIQMILRYNAKTKYTTTEKIMNKRVAATRKTRATGMKIWNALLLHDTLTENYLTENRQIDSSARGRIQAHLDHLKRFVKSLIMDPGFYVWIEGQKFGGQA
jgi:hypothetical protein